LLPWEWPDRWPGASRRKRNNRSRTKPCGWIVPTDRSSAPRRLTSTKATESHVAWSPDSHRIAFSTRREGDEAAQIYVLDVTTGGEAIRVTSVSAGADFPAWRPDGGALLFTSLVYPGATDDAANRKAAAERKNRKYTVRAYETFPVRRWDRWLDDRQLHVFAQSLDPGARAIDLLAGTQLARSPGYGGRNLDEGEQLDAVLAPRVLTASFDRSVQSWGFTSDSRSIYLTAEDAGLEKVYTNLNIVADAVTPIIVANWGSAIDPAEVVRIDPATRQHRRLTTFAVEQAARLDWQPLQHFWFTSARGRRIHSMVAMPPGFDPAKKYPLLVEIHGGFASMWRDQITLRWNYHLLAQPGYIVLLTNYTGSTGFGEKFSRDILFDPFDGPTREINEAADEAIRRFSYIDGSRQAAAGASYGGHLVNWLEGTTTRYRCLISHAGLVNSEAQWGTSDGIYHRELIAGGPPWEQAGTWREQNPIRNAARFKTPMLLSVGENDFRVPLNNTLENWSALQRMRVPSRLLVWPNATHWITSGEDSRHFYEEVHAWLRRWLAPVVSQTTQQ
jgi:dipeptidyl aminopeptidase/acylaminoacyl peptidase